MLGRRLAVAAREWLYNGNYLNLFTGRIDSTEQTHQNFRRPPEAILILDKVATPKSGSQRAWRSWRTWCVVIAVGASSFAGSGVASAQGELAQAQGEPPGSNVELAPPVALTERREVDLSPEERLQSAQELVSGIERSSQSVLRQLQVARQERDVVRVLCLNDKLNQVDVALRSAQDRMAALRTAVERADTDRARHEYTVLDVLNDRVRLLVSESGILAAADVQQLRASGVHAFLVGEAFMRADDPGQALASLFGLL